MGEEVIRRGKKRREEIVGIKKRRNRRRGVGKDGNAGQNKEEER